ncbi:MAG TPA: carboxylating nicotinate-nucleotide diphosphorylase [Bacteroidota bacterium]|nr:carboxylating nicotinate-nucleotide diphosphorylase [Bacteroidota bacterium]
MIDPLNDSRISRILEEALLEDVGMGDVTTEGILLPDAIGRGDIIAKEPGLIAGLDVVHTLFQIVDRELLFTQYMNDGSAVARSARVASVEGNLVSILKCERTALNILQRMSGIATLTRKFVDAVNGTRAKITDTRKTAPGLRILDKLAVKIGGGVNHRFGLDDMVLIKDNHVAAAGSIDAAIDRCLAFLSAKKYQLRIEVEATSVEEVGMVLRHTGVHRIMLDNFSTDEMRRAVELIGHSVEVEASGNVSLQSVRAIAETGVDFISVGALTHSPRALDISLDLAPPSSQRP